MKTSVAAASLLWGLILATPVVIERQSLPVEEYEAVADVASATGAPVGDAAPQTSAVYDPTSAASVVVQAVTSPVPSASAIFDIITLKKRDIVCTTRVYNGPQVTSPSDSPAAFQVYQPFIDAAVNAAKSANVPAGYAVVPEFMALNAAAKDASYLTYVSSRLSGYDVDQCASLCNTMSGCTAFNICKLHLRLGLTS
jgi:hypothetical protein